MSKRLLILFTALLLTVPTIVSGQELMDDEPVFFLTEQQLNAEFTIPSTATRTISNLVVDVQEGGVHVSFEMTAISDGSSNTIMVGAVLSGLVPVRVSQVTLENTLVTSYVAPRRLQREVTNLIGRAWRNYVCDAIVGAASPGMHLEDISLGLYDDGIYFYQTLGTAGGAGVETLTYCV